MYYQIQREINYLLKIIKPICKKKNLLKKINKYNKCLINSNKINAKKILGNNLFVLNAHNFRKSKIVM